MALPLVPPELRKIALGLEIKLKGSLVISILVFDISHTFLSKKLIDWTKDDAFVIWEKKDD